MGGEGKARQAGKIISSREDGNTAYILAWQPQDSAVIARRIVAIFSL